MVERACVGMKVAFHGKGEVGIGRFRLIKAFWRGLWITTRSCWARLTLACFGSLGSTVGRLATDKRLWVLYDNKGCKVREALENCKCLGFRRALGWGIYKCLQSEFQLFFK